ncbi:ATP-binding cassette domain-containing protein [Glycomyces sp. A-F 0318]|uniref:ABC transporter ATP-binding protein n=1 Tax=Glycomyces amatae TaxID=2881355 RepID=UPI001E52658E|nr:ATP-binding cassette domain-containing protein [Glycomyces amatae]MCD0445685.1 ATP-binding cassette domain-containing protein [Glycomyces amatae]
MTTPPPTAPRLEVDGLEVAFGGLTALGGVSFEVRDGETVALIGPNGAGKTTVFNAVCGIVKPRKGNVRIGGRPAPARTTGLLAAGVARTLQGLGLFERMTVLENVLVPLSSLRAEDAAARARDRLAELGLLDLADRSAGTLPYPERKRVALARALAADPRLLLLDEPAGGLGAADIEALAETVRRVAGEGCAVLLVEHHVDFVMDVADRIVVLDFGEVIAAGSPEEVRRDPAVEAAYLGLEAVNAAAEPPQSGGAGHPPARGGAPRPSTADISVATEAHAHRSEPQGPAGEGGTA